MNLSNKQQQAFDEIMHFFLSSQDRIFVFSGVAGSGKSTIINLIVNYLRKKNLSVATIALTGKAVNVMKSKGITDAKTIHSYMYNVITDDKGNFIEFVKRARSDFVEDFIIVDEASMVNEELCEDLFDIGKKILFVGDVNQLPPISKTNFNLMDEYNVRLEEIHRQAADNPIIQLSQHVLENDTMPINKFKSDVINFITRRNLVQDLQQNVGNYETVLCGTNKVRLSINKQIRKINQTTGHIPHVGERVICLRNRKGYFNGETFTVNKVYMNPTNKLEMHTYEVLRDGDDERFFVNVEDDVWDGNGMQNSHFFTELNERVPLDHFDYGYCITVHKSQGSEYSNLLFVDEDVSYFVDRSRFRYTAITRAKERITIAK